MTFTSYIIVDYKAPSLIERIETFLNVVLKDLSAYNNKLGLVTLEMFKLHLEEIVADFF